VVRLGPFGGHLGSKRTPPGGPPLSLRGPKGAIPRGGPNEAIWGGQIGAIWGQIGVIWGHLGSDLRGGTKKGLFLDPFSLRGLRGGLEGQIQDLRLASFGPNLSTRFRGILGFGRSPKHPKSSKNGYFGVTFLRPSFQK